MANKESWENDAGRTSRIRKSMRHWRLMDEAGSRLGRGLGRRELIARVAMETGVSQREVESAVRREAV